LENRVQSKKSKFHSRRTVCFHIVLENDVTLLSLLEDAAAVPHLPQSALQRPNDAMAMIVGKQLDLPGLRDDGVRTEMAGHSVNVPGIQSKNQTLECIEQPAGQHFFDTVFEPKNFSRAFFR
jgi:hypothetical protein